MQRLEIKKSPFINNVDYGGVVHWIKPKLVANFKFATFTKSGSIRKPAIFLGFRDDKQPTSVVEEKATKLPIVVAKSEKRVALPKASAGSNCIGWKK